MAHLQVRNLPEELHERLRAHARARNCSMSSAVVQAIQRELDRWEWQTRLASRPRTDPGISAAERVAEVRRLRDAELESRR